MILVLVLSNSFVEKTYKEYFFTKDPVVLGETLLSSEFFKMSPLIRMCVPLPLQTETKMRPDGSHYVDGTMSEVGNELINLLERMSRNQTFHVTTSTEECLERVKNNQSDIATSFVQENMSGYRVPVPMFLNKVEFLTGYNLMGKSFKPMDYGTVFDNATLLQMPVYLCTLLFLLLFFLVICLRILTLKHQRSRKKPKNGYFIKRVVRETSLVFYTKSESQLINLLFSILCFYLITCFMILYKTSRIIVEQPYVVTSYEQLIEDKTALPSFFDSMAQVSQKFESAPVETLKGKIWQKLITSGENWKSHVHVSLDYDSLIQIVLDGFRDGDTNHSVLFASSRTMNLVKSMFCGSSPQNELWRLEVFSDQSEDEELFGWPISPEFLAKHGRFFVLHKRRLFESTVILKFYKWAMDTSSYAYEIAQTDKKHINQQNLACSDDFSLETDIQVKAIGLEYFASFFGFSLFLFFLARMVNVYEILFFKKSKN